MGSAQITLFEISPRAARQQKLPDPSRGKHHGNQQSEDANKRIHERKSDWYPVILSEARLRREVGITLAEFVEKWNRDHRFDRPYHKITPNDVSGRFTELGEAKRLVRVELPSGRFMTRGGRHAIWFLPPFAPEAGAQ
jgi:hypothetical protein